MSAINFSRLSQFPFRESARVLTYAFAGLVTMLLWMNQTFSADGVVRFFTEYIAGLPLMVVLTPDLALITLWPPMAVALFWHLRRTRPVSRKHQLTAIAGIVAVECLLWIYTFDGPRGFVSDVLPLALVTLVGYIPPVLFACWALDTVVRGINRIGVFLNARN